MSGWRKRQIIEAMSMYTIDEFEDLTNESFPPVVIAGREYGRGTALRRIDPEQFNIEYHDWMNYLDECAEDRVN
jgi:hypothetical protein